VRAIHIVTVYFFNYAIFLQTRFLLSSSHSQLNVKKNNNKIKKNLQNGFRLDKKCRRYQRFSRHTHKIDFFFVLALKGLNSILLNINRPCLLCCLAQATYTRTPGLKHRQQSEAYYRQASATTL
jgi:hypothetical protein